MKSWIILKEMNFFAFHGIGEQEKICGNKFTVNLKLAVNLSEACKTDDIKDTISYADVYQIVHEEMSVHSNLIEHAAMRIIKCIFNRFPLIERIQIELEKNNPPMNADILSAGIELDCNREEII